MEDVTVQKFRNGELISTQHYETLDSDNWREQLRQQEQDLRNSLDDAFYREQHQSEQFRVHDPILKNFEQPSMDLQSYKPLELSQPHMDNFQSLETKSTMEVYKPFSTTQRGIHNISATPQLLSHSSSQAFQMPDFSKFQNMANQMNTQFNNFLPSPLTVYQDHFIYNDVGRSFQQPQIYQPQSAVDLGIIHVSAPAFYIPRIEPIHIPQVPMPIYQPPAIPNF